MPWQQSKSDNFISSYISYLLLQMNGTTKSEASPSSDDRESEGERQVSESETVMQASDQRTRQVNYTLSANSSLPGAP